MGCDRSGGRCDQRVRLSLERPPCQGVVTSEVAGDVSSRSNDRRERGGEHHRCRSEGDLFPVGLLLRRGDVGHLLNRRFLEILKRLRDAADLLGQMRHLCRYGVIEPIADRNVAVGNDEYDRTSGEIQCRHDLGARLAQHGVGQLFREHAALVIGNGPFERLQRRRRG